MQVEARPRTSLSSLTSHPMKRDGSADSHGSSGGGLYNPTASTFISDGEQNASSKRSKGFLDRVLGSMTTSMGRSSGHRVTASMSLASAPLLGSPSSSGSTPSQLAPAPWERDRTRVSADMIRSASTQKDSELPLTDHSFASSAPTTANPLDVYSEAQLSADLTLNTLSTTERTEREKRNRKLMQILGDDFTRSDDSALHADTTGPRLEPHDVAGPTELGASGKNIEIPDYLRGAFAPIDLNLESDSRKISSPPRGKAPGKNGDLMLSAPPRSIRRHSSPISATFMHDFEALPSPRVLRKFVSTTGVFAGIGKRPLNLISRGIELGFLLIFVVVLIVRVSACG